MIAARGLLFYFLLNIFSLCFNIIDGNTLHYISFIMFKHFKLRSPHHIHSLFCRHDSDSYLFWKFYFPNIYEPSDFKNRLFETVDIFMIFYLKKQWITMEITKYNFTRELDNITKNLEKACYIGFDAEFASLLTGDRYKYRYVPTYSLGYWLNSRLKVIYVLYHCYWTMTVNTNEVNSKLAVTGILISYVLGKEILNDYVG